MSESHTVCLHEEQIMKQSLVIERLGVELEFKREKLDDLKEDNKRIESKIDKLGDDFNNKFNEFINTSNEKDDKLDKRLTKIETRQEEQDKAIKTNNQKSRDNYQRLAVIIAIVSVVIGAIALFK